MNASPVTILDDCDYKAAFSIMDEHGIHHLPVINKRHEVVGLTSLRDLQIAARRYLESPVEIREVMHKATPVAYAEDSLANAARLMRENHCDCLPVMDNNNHVVGMLTETDMLQALSDLLADKS
jgi:acetoin utilization protein AcuB